ncbi:hypothetical protein B0T18DRAFT_389209 [Schizothecium vesticola]|uniref:Uncharacterized protein n=1 Tax=Schizothecium vesticola TaxID=314040 RepID=A0AA40K8U0_9PEZI|nr:hypothetical protein B0T18DRAFT_389209 [Schizothecium vesticola]
MSDEAVWVTCTGSFGPPFIRIPSVRPPFIMLSILSIKWHTAAATAEPCYYIRDWNGDSMPMLADCRTSFQNSSSLKKVYTRDDCIQIKCQVCGQCIFDKRNKSSDYCIWSYTQDGCYVWDADICTGVHGLITSTYMNADSWIRFAHYTYMFRYVSIGRRAHCILSEFNTLSYKSYDIDWDCRHYDPSHSLSPNHTTRSPA